MEIQDIIDLTANVLAIAVMVVKAAIIVARWLTPRTQSVWRRTKREIAAEVSTMRTARLRPTTARIVAVAWGIGGFSSYTLTGGMEGAAPLWATYLGGSLAMALWCIAAWQGWLAVRWAGRSIGRLL